MMEPVFKLKGFTLIELIVVIGIIAILAAIVIIAINPARQFAQARNTQRSSDVTQVLNAVYQQASDNNGDVVAGISACPIVEEVDGATFGAGNNLTLTSFLVPNYLSAMPADPRPRTAEPNNYTICLGASNRVTVAAPSAELGATISVTR